LCLVSCITSYRSFHLVVLASFYLSTIIFESKKKVKTAYSPSVDAIFDPSESPGLPGAPFVGAFGLV
jgi:hypothetical protein